MTPTAFHRRTRAFTAFTAFTLVELLTVIAVIVVLLGMFLVAFKYVRNAGARATTKVSMDALRGMLADYDTASHLNRAPVMWNWYQATSSSGTVNTSSGPFGSTNVTPDFWRYPFSTTANTATTPPVWEALDAPGFVQTDSSPQADLQRAASNAILNTQLALQLFAGVQSNKSAFDKLSTGSKFYLPYVAGTVLAAPIIGNVGLLNDDPSMPDSTLAIKYPQSIHVSSGNKYYVSIKQTSAPVTSPSDWYDESNDPPRGVPVILDGWGNPIIFVPASGLHVRLLNGKSKYDSTDVTQNVIVISPEGSVTGNGSAAPVVTKVGRPFFASAGPDGDFTKGDDNVYSFEN